MSCLGIKKIGIPTSNYFLAQCVYNKSADLSDYHYFRVRYTNPETDPHTFIRIASLCSLLKRDMSFFDIYDVTKELTL